MEDDDLVHAVQKFGFELLLEFVGDLLLHAVVLRFILLRSARKTKAAHLVHLARTDVGRHDDDGIFKADHAALAVGEAPVVEDLQQNVEHVRMRLFDFVEEYHRIGFAADLFGELTARVVEPDVSRRRADELADRMLFHEFAHVQADHQPFIAEHRRRERLGKLRFAHARGADEDERTDRSVRVFEPRAGAADRLCNGGNSFLLPDHPLVQLILEMQKPLALLLGELDDGNTRPARDDFGDILRADRRVAFAAVFLPVGADGFDLPFRLFDLLQDILGGEEVVLAHRLILFGNEPLDLLFLFLDARGAVVAVEPCAACRLVNEVDRLIRQKAVGDVAVGKARRRDDRVVADGHFMVRLVLVAQTAQNFDGFLHARLLDVHGGKAALERGIFFDILAVFVDGGRADGLQLAARKHRL